MRRFRARWLPVAAALVTGATALQCSGWPGPLAIFGGPQGLIGTIGLQIGVELLQAVLIGLLGTESLTGPLVTVPVL